VQHGVDGRRVGVQVEQGAHAGNHLGQRGQQAVAHAQQQLGAGVVKAGLQPARMHAGAARQPQRAAQGAALDLLQAVNAPRRKKVEQRPHVQRRPVAQVHGVAAVLLRRALAPQLGGVEAVVRAKRRIEAPQAGKAAGQRHLGHGQARVGQELLGRQQPPRLQVLQRRDA